MTSSRQLRRWTALYGFFLLWIIAAADLGHLPITRWLHHFPWGDKVGHFVLMGLLGFLLNLCLGLRRWRPYDLGLMIGSTVVALMATLEEISQLWFPSRRFDPWDLVADLAGLLLFDLLARRAGRIKERLAAAHGSPGPSSTSG